MLSILFMKTFVATFYVLIEYRTSFSSLVRRDDKKKKKRPLVHFSVLLQDILTRLLGTGR